MCRENVSERAVMMNDNHKNLPSDSKPLFNMLNFIVFGIETKLVELSVFFFLGFSRSA